MALNKFQTTSGFLVFCLLLIYSMYTIAGVFNGYPIWPSNILIVIAASLGVLSVGFSVVNGEWDGRLPKSIALFYFLAFFLVFSVLMQNVFLSERFDVFGRSSHQYTQAILTSGFAWMICVGALQRVVRMRSLVFSLIIILFLVFFIFSNLQESLVISYKSLSENRSDGVELNHLIVGESVSLLLILAFAFSPDRWRIFFVIASVFVLFALGGRTSLFTYFIAVSLYFLLKNSLRVFLIYAVVVASIMAVVYLNIALTNLDDSGVARMLLLDGVNADSSAVERNYILGVGASELPSQVLMGDPTFMIRRFGTLGLYIHNLLSAWQFFGLIPFLSFCISIIWIGCYIWLRRKSLSDSISDFGVLFFIYSVVSMLTGKSITYHSFWFVIGFWLFRMGCSPNLRLPIKNREY